MPDACAQPSPLIPATSPLIPAQGTPSADPRESGDPVLLGFMLQVWIPAFAGMSGGEPREYARCAYREADRVVRNAPI